MAYEQHRKITACSTVWVTTSVAACALMTATALATAQGQTEVQSPVQSPAQFQAPSQVQYIWIDDNGIRHFSDRPPSPSVPQKQILKEPDSKATLAQPVRLPASEPGQKSTMPSGIALRNADFIKRRAEAAAAEQLSTQEAERRSALARNCEDVLRNQRLLDSGAPVGSIAPDGSRLFLSDEARVLASKRNQDALARCQ